jgi:hypothetical protein
VGLLQKLPEPDTEWSLRDRERWLRTASNIFDLMYLAPEGDIAASSPIPATPRRQEEEL